jgi:pre-mRNA-splicing factor ISY1
MARNAEKANSFLYRFRDAQHVEMGLKGSDRRPFLASSCHNMTDAERFRNQVLREISGSAAKIQGIQFIYIHN